MGNIKTKKEIPDGIRYMLAKKIANSETDGSTRYKQLAKLIKDFLKKKKEKVGYKYHGYYITVTGEYTDFAQHLRRTYSEGGVKRVRDILCLFATDGECDWDQLISKEFADKEEYLRLLDDEDKKNALSHTKDEPEEKKIVQKQIHDEGRKKTKHQYISKDINPPESNNDPTNPEFPPAPFYKPKFPATKIKKIKVPGSDLPNVWIKDESTNPTGTHKDRMAWEVTLLASDKDTNIPEMSIISSGSAAIAIQNMFNKFKVDTKLKVLVDNKLPKEIRNKLEDAGATTESADLSRKELSSEEIKCLTGNKKGIDITYRENIDFKNKRYYDWMSYEILNFDPDYCLVPFGTGDLFINILKVLQDEIKYLDKNESHDPRFSGSISHLKKCHFWGVTTDNKDTQMDKLYSYHLPHIEDYKTLIEKGKKKGEFGKKTDIKYVGDENIERALEIAKEQDISCEPSGIAGLALLIQKQGEISPEDKVLIINTGKTDYDLAK